MKLTAMIIWIFALAAAVVIPYFDRWVDMVKKWGFRALIVVFVAGAVGTAFSMAKWCLDHRGDYNPEVSPVYTPHHLPSYRNSV